MNRVVFTVFLYPSFDKLFDAYLALDGAGLLSRV